MEESRAFIICIILYYWSFVYLCIGVIGCCVLFSFVSLVDSYLVRTCLNKRPRKLLAGSRPTDVETSETAILHTTKLMENEIKSSTGRKTNSRTTVLLYIG